MIRWISWGSGDIDPGLRCGPLGTGHQAALRYRPGRRGQGGRRSGRVSPMRADPERRADRQPEIGQPEIGQPEIGQPEIGRLDIGQPDFLRRFPAGLRAAPCVRGAPATGRLPRDRRLELQAERPAHLGRPVRGAGRRGDELGDALELGVRERLGSCARALDRLVHPLVHVHARGDRGGDRRDLGVGDARRRPGSRRRTWRGRWRGRSCRRGRCTPWPTAPGSPPGWRSCAPASRSPWRWRSGAGRRGSSASGAAGRRVSGSRRPCSSAAP